MNIFKMRRAGPFQYGAPGPARSILKMFISKKLKMAVTPCIHRYRIGLVRPSVETSEIIIFKMRRAGPLSTGPRAQRAALFSFFEIIIFKKRRAGPGAPYLRGPRAAC